MADRDQEVARSYGRSLAGAEGPKEARFARVMAEGARRRLVARDRAAEVAELVERCKALFAGLDEAELIQDAVGKALAEDARKRSPSAAQARLPALEAEAERLKAEWAKQGFHVQWREDG